MKSDLTLNFTSQFSYIVKMHLMMIDFWDIFI